MKKRIQTKSAILITLVFFTGCARKDSGFEKSNDGKTYLEVDGGKCNSLEVDGKVWNYAMGQRGPVDPGHHRISCGTVTEIEIPKGVVAKVLFLQYSR